MPRLSDSGYGPGMLQLPDAWVWDSWYASSGGELHAFYLKASRALGDPEVRHAWPIVGHAVSTDGLAWRELRDALAPGRLGGFDDQGIWTGSVLRGPDGTWHMYYTGVCRATMTSVQRIGHAVSHDLMTWQRVDEQACVVADARWYQTFALEGDEPWRDPWVFRWQSQWHMLITARRASDASQEPSQERSVGSAEAPFGEEGCIGHAVSDDLYSWEVRPPLADGLGLNQLEVLQVVEVDGAWVCIFCLSARDVVRPGLPRATGTWSMPCQGPLGPFDIDAAEPMELEGNYAGRVVEVPGYGLSLMAFIDRDAQGQFSGSIGGPVPLGLTVRGTLQPRVAQPRRYFLESGHA